MNYSLKNVNGKVAFLLRSGKDFVKNQMAIASAQHIIDTGKLEKSDVAGYPICVDNQWYFEGELQKKPIPTKDTAAPERRTIAPTEQEDKAE